VDRRSASNMIDSNAMNDRPKSRPVADPALDEARLRQQAIPDEFLDILRRADKKSEGA